MELVSLKLKERISDILHDMLDLNGGLPDLSGALEELIAVGSKDDKADPPSAEELVVAMGGIEGEILMRPDHRGLPVTIYPDRDSNTCFILSISDPERVLSIRLDPAKTKIVGLWIRPSSLTDFTWDLNRQVASLERPLRILSRPFDEVTSIENYIKERGFFSEIARRHAASKFYKPSVAPAKVTNGVRIKEEVDAIEGDVMSVALSDLWEALLDAEASIVPVVSVIGEPVEIQSSNVLSVPVGGPHYAYRTSE